MSFLTGFSFIIWLLIFTVLLEKVSKIIPKEFVQAIVVFMIFGDAVLVAIHYYGIKDIVENIKEFKLGIAAAFGLMSILRSIYFLITSQEYLK